MYKFDKKNFMMFYEFNSINEFCRFILNTPINYSVFSEPASVVDYEEFTGTKNFEEAINLLKYGDSYQIENFRFLKKSFDNLLNSKINRNQEFNYYIGYAPNVKAYLEGSPLNMLYKERRKETKVLDIYFNCSCSAKTDILAIYNRGAITLSFIDYLERIGYFVSLHLTEMSYASQEKFYVEFNLKNYGMRVNISKLCFPMCHSSFLRRCIFRLQEVTPDITEKWRFGYGRPCEKKMMDGWLSDIFKIKDNYIIIPTPQEMGIEGKDIQSDAKNFFNYIGKYYDDLTYQKVKSK